MSQATIGTPGTMARRIRKLQGEQHRVQAELLALEAEEQQERARQARADGARRKLLTGLAVLDWVFQHPRLIRFLRMALAAGLTRTRDRRLFNLGDGPLIPAEDSPGWPDDRPADETLVETPQAGMSPRQRRVRIAHLKKRTAAVKAELDALWKAYAPRRDTNNQQRRILVGTVLLSLSFGNERLTRRLRRLLNLKYPEARDRKLFVLEGDGPLVPPEEQAELRPTRRQAAKPPSSNAGSFAAAGAVRRPRSAPAPANGGGDAEGSDVADPTPNPDPAPDAQAPIPGWKPHKLRVDSRRPTWGAQLKGHAAVQALPKELVGRMITVTDSSLQSWNTRVTGIVSRDHACVIVRNSGRPRSADKRPG